MWKFGRHTRESQKRILQRLFIKKLDMLFYLKRIRGSSAGCMVAVLCNLLTRCLWFSSSLFFSRVWMNWALSKIVFLLDIWTASWFFMLSLMGLDWSPYTGDTNIKVDKAQDTLLSGVTLKLKVLRDACIDQCWVLRFKKAVDLTQVLWSTIFVFTCFNTRILNDF